MDTKYVLIRLGSGKLDVCTLVGWNNDRGTCIFLAAEEEVYAKHQEVLMAEVVVKPDPKDSLYIRAKSAIESFLKREIGTHWNDSLWTHGSLGPGCGAIFNSYPSDFAGLGFGGHHLPGQKAVQFTTVDGIAIVISEYYSFMLGQPASRMEVESHLNGFIEHLRRLADVYSVGRIALPRRVTITAGGGYGSTEADYQLDEFGVLHLIECAWSQNLQGNWLAASFDSKRLEDIDFKALTKEYRCTRDDGCHLCTFSVGIKE